MAKCDSRYIFFNSASFDLHSLNPAYGLMATFPSPYALKISYFGYENLARQTIYAMNLNLTDIVALLLCGMQKTLHYGSKTCVLKTLFSELIVNIVS